MPAKSPHAAVASGRWMKSEKGRMTHELNRDIERKKRGGRTVRRAAPASPSRDERSAREKFLAASLDLFAERNFASVTIKDIAKALNVNTALIYYYFDSKTDLFRATIEYAVAGAFENVRALETAIEQYLNHHNEQCRPFVWTATADAILEKVQRFCERTSETRH